MVLGSREVPAREEVHGRYQEGTWKAHGRLMDGSWKLPGPWEVSAREEAGQVCDHAGGAPWLAAGREECGREECDGASAWRGSSDAPDHPAALRGDALLGR